MKMKTSSVTVIAYPDALIVGKTVELKSPYTFGRFDVVPYPGDPDILDYHGFLRRRYFCLVGDLEVQPDASGRISIDWHLCRDGYLPDIQIYDTRGDDPVCPAGCWDDGNTTPVVWSYDNQGRYVLDHLACVAMDKRRRSFPVAVSAHGIGIAASKRWSEEHGVVFTGNGVAMSPKLVQRRRGDTCQYIDYTCRLVSPSELEFDIGDGIVTIPVTDGSIVWEGERQELLYGVECYGEGYLGKNISLRDLPVVS
jgi:hypothetical protein